MNIDRVHFSGSRRLRTSLTAMRSDRRLFLVPILFRYLVYAWHECFVTVWKVPHMIDSLNLCSTTMTTEPFIIKYDFPIRAGKLPMIGTNA